MRKLLKRASVLLLVLGFAAVLWPLRIPVFESFGASEFEQFLEQHHQAIELRGTQTEFDFPPEFYENRLFLLGENHGVQKVQGLDLALIAHLQKTVGLRWLMAELDPVNAHLFNRYLETGDPELVTPVFEGWLANGTQWGNQQFFEKLVALRDFNHSLPPGKQIRFFGVDRLSESGVAGAEALLASGQLDDRQAAYMNRNIEYARAEESRYTVILANIEAMVERFGIGDDEPLYGFWGIFHVLKATVNDGARPLALRLAETGLPFSDQIISIATVFLESEQAQPSRMLPGFLQSGGTFTNIPIGQDNPYLAYLLGIGDLKKVIQDDEDVVLFHLGGPNSPYRSSPRLRRQTGLATIAFRFEISETDPVASDYMVLIRHSPAVEAFESPD